MRMCVCVMSRRRRRRPRIVFSVQAARVIAISHAYLRIPYTRSTVRNNIYTHTRIYIIYYDCTCIITIYNII